MGGTRVVDGRDLTLPGYGGYLTTFNDRAVRTEDAGHVLLGAQPAPFSLEGRRGEEWPRPGESKPDREMRIPAGYRSGRMGGDGSVPARLRARIALRARVGGRPALTLRVPWGYPAGGGHGDHVIVVWNEHGHGYLVSVHFSGGRGPFRYSEHDRINAALAIADSTTSVAG